MFIIRPIKENDLDGLIEMLSHSGYGLTTLPKDRDVLLKRIRKSKKSFTNTEITKAGGEDYLFVMEELATHKIVGISGIISKIGGFEPYYFYRLKTEVRQSKSLGKKIELQTLHAEVEHSGPSEICSLFLDPLFRNSHNGRFLSLTRFLYIKQNKHLFEDEIIAEMRGQVDDEGNSPFFEAVGFKFFDIHFSEADYLSMKNKKFIKDLLPPYPIIVNLLPKEARDVVGKVHPNTEPAKGILEQEGFSFNGQVGIFEPGPIISATVENIRTVRDACHSLIKEISSEDFKSELNIISTIGTYNFRACLGHVENLGDGFVRISENSAKALQLKIGDEICFVSLRA